MPKNFTPKKTPGADATPPRFDHWESHVAQRAGLTKDEIRVIRNHKLAQGEHWTIEKKRVMYSAQGVQELERVLEVTRLQPDETSRQSDNAEAGGAVKAETITLKVFRAGLKHSQIIEAHFPDKDPGDFRNRVRVRVRSDKNFIKGMEIPVTELQPGLYLLARACPRSRGKW